MSGWERARARVRRQRTRATPVPAVHVSEPVDGEPVEAEPVEAEPVPSVTELVPRQPAQPARPSPTVPAPVGRTLVRVSALGHGVRRALRTENRDRVRALVRRDLIRREKARRRAARRAARVLPISALRTREERAQERAS